MSSDPAADLRQKVADRLDLERLPVHVAFIMDGNGRWAQQRLLKRVQGHEKGSDAVRSVVRTCRELGIPILTLFAFSTENWQRPRSEIDALMRLLKKFLVSEEEEMLQNGIRLNVIGQMQRLPTDVQEALQARMAATHHNEGLWLNLALSYGGREEIVNMAQQLAVKVREGQIQPEQITADLVAAHLYTQNMPDPDLLVRTGGDMRISNFLLWQLAYTEIYITRTLWPDFDQTEFIDILQDYQQRERRFGKIRT